MLSAPLSAVCLQEACTVHNRILPPVSSVLHMCAVSSLESGEPHQVCFFRPIVLTVRPPPLQHQPHQETCYRCACSGLSPDLHDQRVGLESSALCVHKPSREFWCPLTFEYCCFSQPPLPLPFFQLLHSTKHLVGNVFICYSFIHSVLAGDLLSPG